MIRSIVTVSLALCLIGGWLYFKQSAMIFYPSHQLDETPSHWSLPYENVALQTRDGTSLHGWYIPNADAKRVLLFFHGNTGNISHRGESVAIFYRLGLNIFFISRHLSHHAVAISLQ